MDISTFLNTFLLLFVVLGFGAMAGYFCERVGIVNIAIDGQMIFGAFIFAVFGMLFNLWIPNVGGMLFVLPLLLAVLCSVLLSWLFGLLVIKIKTNHVISGTAINLVVAGIATFITAPLGAAISNLGDASAQKLITQFPPAWRIQGALGESSFFFGETILIFAVALLIIGIAMFIINKTRFGLRFKAVGDNPNAVDSQGLNVNRYKWIGVLISGLFASTAGAVFLYGGASMYPQTGYFEGNVAGLGFLALAIVVSGAWKIPFITIAAMIFAALVAIFNQSTAIIPDIQVVLGAWYGSITKSIPFVVSLLMLGVFSWKSVAPKALGKHFDKSLR